MSGDIGFANLPNQIHREVTLKGFDFTLMVVGRSGLGKSTFVNTLFSTDIYEEDKPYPPPCARIPSTTSVQESVTTLIENDVQLTLTLVDTPGFGNGINNTDCWVPIEEYVDNAFSKYEGEESKISRTDIRDCRVHCCLYFLTPCIHGVRPLDIEVMKRLHTKVNIIPVIAKADSLTVDECQLLKERVRATLAEHNINVFEFPEDDDDDEEVQDDVANARSAWPFAVSASTQVLFADDKEMRGRAYPWGYVEVDNPQHSDFVGLRNLIIRTYMQQLIDTTNNVHYERFRQQRLSSLSLDTSISGSPKSDPNSQNFIEQLEGQLKQHEKKLVKMEREMTEVFEKRVREKQQKIKTQEAQLLKEHEEFEEKLKKQQRELEMQREQFEREKKEYEAEEEKRKAAQAQSTGRRKKFF
ncbi:hypothetical protein PTSG_07215 [Salpingoeca rosetta]|uniref:Septin-type G domain-containing protein n=1 Tax=Salpingoeca rosetta (strain ATCC 50818 / BSB-021) TaxID=946362 RepID=F2UEE2_SALR5|nr:uncharacterized protein PTSG_07215 [Salpingoeca rosetta]EGD74992.1 hypothetical protein PTSG_07215 [Salpingoeca rosetta]|eukprot:XP_004992637.1 hypothetical protein PTSG_07215 [Salpingoeca rosetta]